MRRGGNSADTIQDRLRRIYIPQIEDEYGIEGPFGLRQYAFRADTGYHSQDLFYGQTQVGPEALICDKADAGTPTLLDGQSARARDARRSAPLLFVVP